MSWGFVAIAAGTVASAAISSKASRGAAQAAANAANTQAASADAGVAEVRRQFDEVQKLMSPYVGAGTDALASMEDMLGLNGPEKQRAVYAAMSQSPEFKSLTQQGEEAILSNASATGGLRGGNVQSALAQFRPQLLSQLISERFQRLGGLSQMGQSAAAGQASAAVNMGSQVSNLLQQQGAARAGGIIGAGQANAQGLMNVGGAIGNTMSTIGMLKLLKGF